MPFIERLTFGALLLLLGLGSPLSARADVVVVMSAKSNVAPLAKIDAADIFLGRKLRFPDGQQAIPIDQQAGSPERDAFYTNFAGLSPAQLKAHWSKVIFTGRGQPPKALPSSVEIRKFIASNPRAIGYIERSQLDDSVKVIAAAQ